MLAEGALPRQVWTPLMLGEGTDTGIALRICVAAADRAYCHHNPVSGLPAQSGLVPGSLSQEAAPMSAPSWGALFRHGRMAHTLLLTLGVGVHAIDVFIIATV